MNAQAFASTGCCRAPGAVLGKVLQRKVRRINAVRPATRLLRDLPSRNLPVHQDPGDLPRQVRAALPPDLGIAPFVSKCQPEPVGSRTVRLVSFSPEPFCGMFSEERPDPFPVLRSLPDLRPLQVLFQADWFEMARLHAVPVTAATITNVIHLMQRRDRPNIEFVREPVSQDLPAGVVEHPVTGPVLSAGPPQASTTLPARAGLLTDVEPEPLLRRHPSLRCGQLDRAPHVITQVMPLAQPVCHVRPLAASHGTAFRGRRSGRQRAMTVAVHVVLLAQSPCLHRAVASRLGACVCHIENHISKRSFVNTTELSTATCEVWVRSIEHTRRGVLI